MKLVIILVSTWSNQFLLHDELNGIDIKIVRHVNLIVPHQQNGVTVQTVNSSSSYLNLRHGSNECDSLCCVHASNHTLQATAHFIPTVQTVTFD